MAGHVVKRGANSWRLHAFVGLDARGRRRGDATKTVHGTKREADRALAAFVNEVSRDRTATAAAEPVTVMEVLNELARRQGADARAGYGRPLQDRLQAHRAGNRVDEGRPAPACRRRGPLLVDAGQGPVRRFDPQGGPLGAPPVAGLGAPARLQAMIATDSVGLPPLNERKVEPPASLTPGSTTSATTRRQPC